MQSLMFLNCFVQKLSKKTFGGSARTPPSVKEGLKAAKDESIFRVFLSLGERLNR